MDKYKNIKNIWKKLFKYTKYVIITLIVIGGIYVFREPMFAPSIKRYISSKIEKNIDFDNFYISPLSFSLTNVNIDSVFLSKKIVFSFNPIKIIANSKFLIEGVSKITVSDARIVLNESGKKSTVKNEITGIKSFNIDKYRFDTDIYIDTITFQNGSQNIKFREASISLKEENIDINSSLDMGNFIFNVSSQLQRKYNGTFNTLTTIISQDKIISNITLEGSFDTNGNLYQNIKVNELKYRNLDFSGFDGVLSKAWDSLKLDMQGSFGDLTLRHSKNNTNIDFNLYLMKINRNLDGDLKFQFSIQDGIKILNLDVKNLSAFSMGNVNLTFDVTKIDNNTYEAYCNYAINKKNYFKLSKNGDYEIKVIVNDIEIGVITGNIKKGTLKTNLKNVKLSDLPLKSFFTTTVDGMLNLCGQIDEISGQIDFSLKDSNNNEKLTGSLAKSNDIFVLNSCNTNKEILLNVVVKEGDIISADFKFIKIDTLKIFNILGCNASRFSGIATGRIKYQKETFLDFNIKFFDGYFYKNSFKKLDLKGTINQDEITIDRCMLIDHDSRELVNVSGFLGVSEKKIKSSLQASIRDLKMGLISLTSCAKFKGVLDDKKIISGILEVSSVTISGADLGSMSAEMEISSSEVKFDNVKSDQDISARGCLNFKNKQLNANIDCRNFNIKGFHKNFSGVFTFLVNVYGKLSNLSIDISFNIINGRYFALPFSLLSEAKLKNKTLVINKAKLLSNKTVLDLNGTYKRNGEIHVKAKNLDEKIINALVGFKTPLKINLFGYGTIFTNGEKLNCNLILNSQTAHVKNVKLNDVKCDVSFKNSSIYLKNASCNISESQVKANNSFFNIRNKTYGLNLFLVNLRAGFVDFLGEVSLLGHMIKSQDSYDYMGDIIFNNFWISKYKLNSLALKYHIKNKILDLYQQDKTKNDLNIFAKAIFGDTLFIKKLNISKDQGTFDLYGDISKDSINLNVKGVNLESKIIMDIFNCQGLSSGKLDVDLNLLGDIKRPKGKMHINSNNGFFMNIPYDSLGLELNLQNDKVHIDKADVSRGSELQISVKGEFPFYLKKRINDKDNQVNISYEINDYGLSILKYMSSEFIKPSSGRMILNGSFSGRLGKVASNAKLSITGASLELKEYLKKIKNMDVNLKLVDNLLTINNFSLKSGSGKLNVYGNAKLNNFNLNSFNVRFVTTAKGIPVRIPQLPLTNFVGSKSFLQDYSFGEPSFDVRVEGSFKKPKISGKIVLENTRFTYPGVSMKNRELLLPAKTYIDLYLITAKNTRFENSFISSLINGSIHLEGSLQDLNANGKIDSLYGTVNYWGVMFDITSARLEIINKGMYITFMGETSIPSKVGGLSDIVKLDMSRTKLSDLSQPGVVKVVSRDNPNMDLQKVLDKVLRVDEDQDVLFQFSDDVGQQTVRLINQTLAAPFAKAMLRKTKLIDNFKVSYIDRQSSPGLSNNNYKNTVADLMSGTKYSLEKNITNHTLLGYSVTFDEFNKSFKLKHSLEMNHKFTDNLYLSGNYDLYSSDGDYQPDKKIMIKEQIRFGGRSK